MNGLDFFAYEVWMMRQTADRLVRGEPDNVTRNALLESFLIHTRALVGFFRAKHKSDDIVAADYAPTWATPVPQSLSDECERINKQVAHLTTARSVVAVPEKRHDVVAIRGQLEILIDIFLQVVDPSLLSDRFHNRQVSVTFVQTNCTTSME